MLMSHSHSAKRVSEERSGEEFGNRPVLTGWLPDMDLNHDKQIQSLLCYRYTIGQTGECKKLEISFTESSR